LDWNGLPLTVVAFTRGAGLWPPCLPLSHSVTPPLASQVWRYPTLENGLRRPICRV